MQEAADMKFVMTQSLCQEGLERLAEAEARTYVANEGDPNKYLDEMAEADALIVRIGKCDKNVIDNSPNLKVIGRTGVGYDSVDIAAATAAGIPVVITPSANNRSVAEHAVALMFAVSKNIVEAQVETQKGNFSTIRNAGKAFELFGKKAGFIGLGAIGREAAKICRGIGMETLGYDPFMTKEKIEEAGCEYYADYEEMIKDCDFVSLHVPLTEETKNMISMKQMESMKKTAVIINCARGGIVNEEDLIEALEKGIIAGAGTDVFEKEPPMPEEALMQVKNLVFSPHSAAQTKEAVVNMAEMCVKGCISIINGEKWPYVANPDAYKHARWN